ncbi:hypothetical protein FQR65_LT04217 [Abscondita terminalis]|nr:hypothetical protein FQR65_LT04217 [Abscondita terminalis]
MFSDESDDDLYGPSPGLGSDRDDSSDDEDNSVPQLQGIDSDDGEDDHVEQESDSDSDDDLAQTPVLHPQVGNPPNIRPGSSIGQQQHILRLQNARTAGAPQKQNNMIMTNTTTITMSVGNP